jgi:hypothetical protein
MAHPAGSSLASTDGPPGNPQHNDVVHKGLWALTAAPIAVQLARARHQVLPAATRNLLREPGRQRRNSSVPCVTSTLPLRIVQFCNVHVRR